MYTPNPIDASGVELSDELLALSEKLAEQVHEVWAQGRVADGWRYGAVRDDAKKETPCLVPYDALPESEKAYDRSTAYATLRLIVKLGYAIKKHDEE